MTPGRLKTLLVALIFALFAFIVFGLLWFFFLGPDTPVGFGWYLFSFAAGLSMIVLPCTLPLAFVIVPLSMGKGVKKGLGIALAFGIGVAITLSLYGVIAALLGEVAIGTLGAPLEAVKNWLYFIAGAFAFLFALGEIGLVKYRMPSYTGAAPAFIQRQGDYLKALLLGLFLGNIGVGCPHPATPVILTRIAVSGDVFYGWLLFFVHAIGRVLPLLLLALLAIIGVNALSWLVARKEKIERATGWAMVFVAGFIFVLGLFSHDWWVYSGQHTLLEEITQEERFLGIIVNRFNFAEPPHGHGVPTGTGLFGLPLWFGNWVLVFLWVFPMWWYYVKKLKIKNEKLKVGGEEANLESRIMRYRFWLFAAISALLIIIFIYALPTRFLNQTRLEEFQEEASAPLMEEAMGEHGRTIHHEESAVADGLAVYMKASSFPVRTGTTTRLDFFVNIQPGDIPVTDLEIEHEKYMHVIGVRSDLNEFFHIHPDGTEIPGLWSVEYQFAKPGRYKVWSEIQRAGTGHVYAHLEMTVDGSGLREEREVSFANNVMVGRYQVRLEYERSLFTAKPVNLLFHIRDAAGRDVPLEKYLGEDMHLALIKDDLTESLHTHPGQDDHLHEKAMPSGMEGMRVISEARAHEGEEEVRVPSEGIPFAITFPSAGIYKIFAQFRPQGIEMPPGDALTAEFYVEAKTVQPFVVSSWWINLLVSLVLIVLLSWGVYRYIGVKKQP